MTHASDSFRKGLSHHDFAHRHHDPTHLTLRSGGRLKRLETVEHPGRVLVAVLAESVVNVSEADGAMFGRVPE